MLSGATLSRSRAMIIGALAIAGANAAPAAAQSAADFYARKNIRFLVGTDAGAGFSAYSMLMAQFLGKHIPGNPSVTVEHMPGAGGINSLNYLANAAPRDGTAIAIAMPNFFVTPWTEPQAVKFDPSKFRFLGRMSDFGRVLVAWHTAGVKTIDDLKSKEITLGASSRRSTTSIAPMLMNELLGAKFKIITGYTGTGPTMIALERGEVASTTIASATLAALHTDWLRDGKLVVLGGLDFAPLPGGQPRIRDLIADEKKRDLWDFVALPAEFGTAALVAPGVPEERMNVLREAFYAAATSADFAAEAKRRRLDVNPKRGEELDALFLKHGAPSKEIIAEVARLMGVKP